ncbi:hypothetical protein PG228_004556 [Escherichia coli]|nr:hypothetical protein [Escherichia coli]
MTPDIPDSHEEKPFDLPDIPDFPDDFDNMNRIWWEMNHRPETRILPTA